MKTVIRTISAGWKLGLVTLIITLLGGLAAIAGNGVIVNETFDPPTLIPLQGWEGNVANVSRQYVNEGVGGSTAAQVSADLLNGGSYFGTLLYQNGVMMGNARATLQSCQLSFDVKVDRPGFQYVGIGIQSWDGYLWNYVDSDLPVYSSVGVIPIGSYTPGKFKTLVVPLDDPLWAEDLNSPVPLDGPFEPIGKTWQIFVSLDAGSLPDLGQFTLTIDNLKVTTKNPLVPFKAQCSGQVVGFDPAVGYTVKETGNAEHLGNYEETIILRPLPLGGITGPVELTAQNGDKLIGTLHTFDLIQAVISIENGTGRFEGAVGSYIATLSWIDDVSYTATATGSFSTVGSNKK